MNYGIVFALVASITWGFIYNIDQKLVLKTSPLTIFLLGNIIQVAILIPYFFTQNWKSDIFSMDKNQFYLLALNEVLYLVGGLAILYSVKFLSAPIASSFEISYPFFVALVYLLLFGGSLSINFWIGSVLIFIGSMIIMR